MKLHISYTNYRGEEKDIEIEAKSARHGTSKFHKEPQWLLEATELERNVEREYAIKDISYYDIPYLAMNGYNDDRILELILRNHIPFSMEEAPVTKKEIDYKSELLKYKIALTELVNLYGEDVELNEPSTTHKAWNNAKKLVLSF